MMKRTLLGTAGFLILTAGAPNCRADDAARAVIERAIKEQGGADRLEKVKTDRVSIKGTLTVNGKVGEFTSETTLNLPSQFRNIVQVKFGNDKSTVVQLLNGDKAMVTVDGQPKPVVASA